VFCEDEERDLGEPDEHLPQLGPTSVDNLVASLRALTGAAPFVGAALGEAITEFIPGQRIDRLEKFVRILDGKVQALGLTHAQLRESMARPGVLDLLEHGLIQAARAASDERRQYIANLLTRALSDEALDKAAGRKILQVLDQLLDPELIWLRYIALKGYDGADDFFQLHASVLEPAVPEKGSPQEDMDKAALQEAYKETLSRLRLTQEQRGSEETTLFGRLVLRSILDANDEEEE